MFKLLKGGHCYTPSDTGIKDILIARNAICLVDDSIPADFARGVEVIDCRGRVVCPGFIDQHVHITGGGGEQGPASRIPEIMAGEIISAGVTTVVGLLGFDDITRSMAELLAKARALEAEGINSYIYTGSYSVPPATLTGRTEWDIAYIDKVLGVGEIAISDYRSSHPPAPLLKKLAAEALKGGMVGGKAGIVHIHVGDGKDGLAPLFSLLEETEFPIGMFVPTHLNRNRQLFQHALEFARKGGFIDFTAGESQGKGLSVPDAISMSIGSGISIDRITVSSDGNGSDSAQGGSNGICRIGRLFDDIRDCVLRKGLSLEQVIKCVTSNVAKLLKLYPRKGILAAGSDADILVLAEDGLSIDKVIIGGRLFMDGGILLQGSNFERQF